MIKPHVLKELLFLCAGVSARYQPLCKLGYHNLYQEGKNGIGPSLVTFGKDKCKVSLALLAKTKPKFSLMLCM